MIIWVVVMNSKNMYFNVNMLLFLDNRWEVCSKLFLVLKIPNHVLSMGPSWTKLSKFIPCVYELFFPRGGVVQSIPLGWCHNF
jgi:hypothetical protein